MRPLKECHGCLHKLLRQTVELAGGPERARRRALAGAEEIMEDLFPHEITPARIASRFHRCIKKITANNDPFGDFKKEEIRQARFLFDSLKHDGKQSLAGVLELAVRGNSLDFFRSREEIARDFQQRLNFTVNHLAELETRLRPGAGLLLLADNAGECFFDLPLLEFLEKQGVKTTYVVKGAPVQNDITRADLEYSDLAARFPFVIDNGSDVVGLDLWETGEVFRERFFAADVIIAKGMGHFETLGANTDGRLFFLLKAKCSPVAAALGVPRDSYVLKNACRVTKRCGC